MALFLFIFFYFSKINSSKRVPRLSGENPYTLDEDLANSRIMNSERFIGNISKEAVLGKWRVVMEEIKSVKSEYVENSTIEFKENGKYYSFNGGGIFEEGYYRVENDKIIFYDYEQEKEIIYDKVFGNIKENKMILIYPKSLRVLEYEKI
ncbi:MAG: hypothetical protein QXW97_01375 [Candidatus Pacearchaeota archaeon]